MADSEAALAGQVVAITGASSGIGQATALACAREGAAVALAARRADRIEALARRIRDDGGQAVAIPTDVADEASAHAFVRGAADRLGGLDALVNNAGVMLLGPIETSPSSEWRRMIDVNLLGVLYCTQTALPLLRERGGGSIVMISSVGGRVVAKWSGVYSLTKFGLGAFTEVLRQETVADDIRVSLIEPGRVETELRDHMRPEIVQAISGGFSAVTPLAPEDIASAVVFTLGQPRNVHISELLVRPARSPM
jgi:NADP-dependent 3-hydroxy acid dehydrogenase YdfG